MEEPPVGYPPPTLVRRRSPKGRIVFLILFVLVLASLGSFVVSRLTESNAPAPAEPSAPPAESAPARPAPPPSPIGSADASAASLPDAVKTVSAAPAAPPATAHLRDGREANLWYYVARLGDGPGAIYSRDGRQWSFAFACTIHSRMIEFIAVGTGSPGDFDKQSMRAGRVSLPMDATYSKDAGGIISTTLPANHPIFDALANGKDPLEVQLVSARKTVLPGGPGLVRLIRVCRGHA